MISNNLRLFVALFITVNSVLLYWQFAEVSQVNAPAYSGASNSYLWVVIPVLTSVFKVNGKMKSELDFKGRYYYDLKNIGSVEQIFNDARLSNLFLTYSQKCLCSENIEFLIDVRNYQKRTNEKGSRSSTKSSNRRSDLLFRGFIISRYIQPDSERELNISDQLRTDLLKAQADILGESYKFVRDNDNDNHFFAFFQNSDIVNTFKVDHFMDLLGQCVDYVSLQISQNLLDSFLQSEEFLQYKQNNEEKKKLHYLLVKNGLTKASKDSKPKVALPCLDDV
eukprot:Pgem_evm1s10000